MAGSSLKFELPRFDGKGNFGLWQGRVKDVLTQQKIKKALSDVKPESMNDSDWEEMQEQAVSTIRMCLSDSITLQVEDLTKPKEIWDKLEKLYMSKSLSSKLYLKQRLYGLKMSEGSDLMQHVNAFNQIVGDLARVGVKIDDEDRAMILLCSLPTSYETLLTALTCNKETISLDTVVVSLQSHYERRQNTVVDRSQGDGLFVNSNQERGRSSNKQDGSSRGRSKSRNKKKVNCYGCGEQGHYKRDCPKRGQNRGRNSDDC